MKDSMSKQTDTKHSRVARRRARVRADLLSAALQEAASTGLLASYDSVLLAHLLVGMLMRAISWWVEQDEPGPEVMADHILFVLGLGLPSSLLTGTGHLAPPKTMAEN